VAKVCEIMLKLFPSIDDAENRTQERHSNALIHHGSALRRCNTGAGTDSGLHQSRSVKAGWTLFKEEPLVGVGPANFNTEVNEKELYSQQSGAHNEFIRVAAEDGILGIVTYWSFFITVFITIFKRTKIRREYGIYFLIFFCLITVHNGLKISLQPLLLTLAIATPDILKIKRKVNVQNTSNAAFAN